MTHRIVIAATFLLAACGTEQGTTQLEVEMLSVSGQVGGATVPSASGATVSGERFGDQGTFFVDAPDLQMQLSACPLGNLDTDPYGVGGGGEGGGPRPAPEPTDAGVDIGEAQSGLVTGVDCLGRGLTLCGNGGCGDFAPNELDLQIVEENGWRQITADADGASGTVQVSLRYRERH
jgi:hypothetical protein